LLSYPHIVVNIYNQSENGQDQQYSECGSGAVFDKLRIVIGQKNRGAGNDRKQDVKYFKLSVLFVFLLHSAAPFLF
jgi:hypothetical protein